MRHFPLVASLVVATSLACGGAASTVNTPATPGSEPHASGTDAGATPPAASVTPPSGLPKANGTKEIRATAMAADLQALGLDPKNLPELQKLEPEKLRKVMKLFSKSLGVRCNDCHKDDDFKAATPMKQVAIHMWNDWVRRLTFEDGSPLFCDSCHQGKKEMLDRSDKKALSGWMEANFVTKLRRTDKKEHSCETCHGDPFEGRFLAAWKK